MRSTIEVCPETIAIRNLIFSEIERVFDIPVEKLHSKTREQKLVDVRNTVLIIIFESTVRSSGELDLRSPTLFYLSALFCKNDGMSNNDQFCHSTIHNIFKRYSELRDTHEFVAIRNKVSTLMNIEHILRMILDHRKSNPNYKYK